MTRGIYRFVLWVHPPAFQRRFGDEMMSIFDESGHGSAVSALLLDGVISLGRQWLLRTGAWKLPLAMSGDFVQIFGSVYLREGSQMQARNHQALSPFLQELMLITLSGVCLLLIMVVSVTVWASGFQRESRRRRIR